MEQVFTNEKTNPWKAQKNLFDSTSLNNIQGGEKQLRSEMISSGPGQGSNGKSEQGYWKKQRNKEKISRIFINRATILVDQLVLAIRKLRS